VRDEIAAVDTKDVELELLLEAIYRKYGYDFREYATPTIQRRLLLASEHLGCRNLSQLQERLLHDEGVLPHVLRYIVVQTTDMFRDPEFFRELRDKVVPHLKTYPFVRVWAAGCSTGEELYSLAILFREEGLEKRTQFYATDINLDALRIAEHGIYALDRIPSFTTNHQLSGGRCSLSEYYTAAYNAAIFDRTLRERTVFADHSLVSDSVFAEVQLVLCRNVLIYFSRPLQDRAIGLFREALVHRGFLGIGARESLCSSAHAAAFENFDPDQKIYRKIGAI
jgi:chemotaxis protein methyltransferase CheR